MRVRLALAAAAAALAVLGCSDDDAVEGAPPACPDGQPPLDDGSCAPLVCVAGEVRTEAGCEPAGLPADMPCAPGEWQDADGTCVPAGVPEGQCAMGFVHDGDRGCEPILPASCPAGQIAVPGDSDCREVAACGTGTWGEIISASDTQFVDAAYTGGGSTGSMSAPWTTIGEAVAAASSGATVAIAAGDYAEDVVVRNKSLTLWGRCPSMVTISGAGVQVASVILREASGGSTVRGVAISGSGFGLLSTAGTGVTVQEVWIHDTGDRGLDVEDSLGPSEVTLRDSLIENATDLGAIVLGAELTLDRSVVRGTRKVAGQSGRGMTVASGVIHLDGSVVEGNSELGIGLFDASSAEVMGSVIRDTSAVGGGQLGWGLSADSTDSGQLLPVRVSGSYIAGHVDYGISARGAAVTIDSTVVRDIAASPLEARGVGIRVIEHGGLSSQLDLRTSLISDVVAIGVQVAGSQMTAQGIALRNATGIGWGAYIAQQQDSGALARAVIDGFVSESHRDTGLFVNGAEVSLTNGLIRDIFGVLGRGIDVEDIDGNVQSHVLVRATLVESVYESALFGMGAVVTAERCHFRDALADGTKGRAVAAQYDFYTMRPSSLLLDGTRVDRATEFGVFAQGSSVEIVDSAIRDAIGLPDGLRGDGVAIESIPSSTAAASIEHSLIENSNRAAIVTFGSEVALKDNRLQCQVLDLDGELGVGGLAWGFVDEGDNLCGCPEATDECKVLSTGIEPPDPLEPSE